MLVRSSRFYTANFFCLKSRYRQRQRADRMTAHEQTTASGVSALFTKKKGKSTSPNIYFKIRYGWKESILLFMVYLISVLFFHILHDVHLKFEILPVALAQCLEDQSHGKQKHGK